MVRQTPTKLSDCRPLGRSVFPRSPERGHIEAWSWHGGSRIERRFPRSPERGHIEASGCRSPIALERLFPRSPERGHIEARRCRCNPHRWPMDFRAHPSAATLKHPERLRRNHPCSHFRAHPSAATLKLAGMPDGQRGAGQFPRSPERGHIEAFNPAAIQRPIVGISALTRARPH